MTQMLGRPRRTLGSTVLLALIAAWSPSSAWAQTMATRVALGTATKGGGFELFGRHVAAVINEIDNTLHVEPVATKGSKENLPLLEAGKIDIGLVEGNAARQALEGIDRPRADLKVLSVMYPNPGMFVVRADMPYRSIDDLKGKRIAFSTRASGLRILAHDVLDGMGLDADRDFEPVILERAADGPRLVLEGRVAALWGAGIGWPGFRKVAEGPLGARFIVPDKAQLTRIRKLHPHLRSMSVPAGTYKGQAGTIDSVGLWALILARTNLSDDVAFRLARALHRGERTLAERLAQGRYTRASNTVNEVPRERLHPGAARYFREIGILR